AGTPEGALETCGSARLRRVPGNQLGRGDGAGHEVARRGPRERSQPTRLLHWPRSVPGTDGVVRSAIRHPKLRRPRRVLLGQHGRGWALYLWRLVLGVWRAGLGAHEVLYAFRCG